MMDCKNKTLNGKIFYKYRKDDSNTALKKSLLLRIMKLLQDEFHANTMKKQLIIKEGKNKKTV
jgi:hypothetical protein